MSKAVNLIMAALLFAGLAMMPAAVTAQTSTTGSVEGTVTDVNGAVVPNATVVLSGPGLVRPQTATADSNGNYRFLQVPPGKYTVRIEATGGFDATEQQNVEVNLSKSTSVNVILAAKGVSTTVDVVASTPEIDQSTNT